MFTGIIEEIGTVASIKEQKNTIVLKIHANKILEDVHLGDSISINGICLTVTSFTKNEFQLDVMPETIKSTSLKNLQKGSKVNLERAMSAKGRFGGHFVSGHVDGIGKIRGKKQVENAIYYEIEAEPSLLKYIILKGSVAVDGASLTVFGINDAFFTISLIPHTLSETIFYEKGTGDLVNIECDMLGKYIEHFLYSEANQASTNKKSTISYSMLKDNGFA